jgi:tRNA wybutosine-synthesizing protein 1
MKLPTWDPPEKIVEGIIKAQLAILSGYRGNPETNRQKFKEAIKPKHVAISLSGEPTLYSSIGKLLRLFRRKELTTFLVSNGTVLSILSKLAEEPTQLYISVCAPDHATFKQTCRPQISNAWEKLNETLVFLPGFRCPTVMRISLAHGLNMRNIRGYARLVEKANPTYVEAKAYMHVGFSRLRLRYENMPDHSDVLEFLAQVANETGYRIVDESVESRVVLLSRLQKPIRFGNG